MARQLTGGGRGSLPRGDRHRLRSTRRKSGAESGALRCRQWSLQTPSDENETAALPAFANNTAVEIPPRGVEGLRSSSRKTRVHKQGDVKSDVGVEKRTKSPALEAQSAVADLAARLACLPPEVLAALDALFGGLLRQQ